MTLVIAPLQFEIRALARRAADELDEPPRTPHARQGQRRLGQGGDPPPRRGCRLSEIGRLSLATPTTQRNAETSRAFGGELARPPRCGHRKARDLRNDRAQPDMTEAFLKAIEGRLLVATFEIDDRSDFRSAWASAGRRDRTGRDTAGLSLARPLRDTGDGEGSRRPVERAVAATGDVMQRPKRRPPTGSRASISASPNGNAVVTRRRRSSIWRTWAHRTSMSDGGRADLMELLGWRFEHVRSSSGFPESSRHIRSLRLRVSGADTKGFP